VHGRDGQQKNGDASQNPGTFHTFAQKKETRETQDAPDEGNNSHAEEIEAEQDVEDLEHKETQRRLGSFYPGSPGAQEEGFEKGGFCPDKCGYLINPQGIREDNPSAQVQPIQDEHSEG
jgi:hypothetical protein